MDHALRSASLALCSRRLPMSTGMGDGLRLEGCIPPHRRAGVGGEEEESKGVYNRNRRTFNHQVVQPAFSLCVSFVCGFFLMSAALLLAGTSPTCILPAPCDQGVRKEDIVQ